MNGHCAITATTRGSSAAVSITCPPPKEVPHRITRPGSTSGRVRANATAERPIFELLVDIDHFPLFAGAVTEVAIVEDQARVSGCTEAFGERSLEARGKRVTIVGPSTREPTPATLRGSFEEDISPEFP